MLVLQAKSSESFLRGDCAQIAAASYRFYGGIVTPPGKRYGAVSACVAELWVACSRRAGRQSELIWPLANQAACLPRFLFGPRADGQALRTMLSLRLTVAAKPSFSVAEANLTVGR